MPDKPDWLIALEEWVNEDFAALLQTPGGGEQLASMLATSVPATLVATHDSDERRLWEYVGLYFRAHQRQYDAIAVYSSLYYHFLRLQQATGSRVHKGMPLVWLAECYFNIRNIPISKRYLMLTLVEDAITEKGRIDPAKTGSFFRLAWWHGLSSEEISRYGQQAYKVFRKNRTAALFPEHVLQELDNRWLVELPTPNDSGIYNANGLYVEHLLSQIGEPTGRVLEALADYLLSCIPGCRTARRQRSVSTDYDIVCTLEGPDVDFRSEFGRYFICECKDWARPTDFAAFAKFARVLDSTKARFGVLFSRQGITGQARRSDAAAEQLKLFQDRGMIIVVIDLEDLRSVSKGANLISLLREKYERIRLDLA